MAVFTKASTAALASVVLGEAMFLASNAATKGAANDVPRTAA